MTDSETDGVLDLDAYDAVVYDLDGTLVELAVDWGAVADAVIDVYVENAIKPPTDELWGLLEASEEYGIGEPVEEAISLHERAGARDSIRLPLGDRLVEEQERADAAAGPDAASLPDPVGICSLNSEAACRIAVETHGLDVAVAEDAIVGRDTVGTHKPEPESLLATIERLGSEPGRALFVGDSQRDAVTADRAGVDYVWAAELLNR